ncbi:hypothetical protein AMAG_04942 [Allomyces macrogynus ATCC 38327]|uniref:Cytochrome P450 n=1 Tax=Allomyces macrogynus (strain ATCC 38327) TaxID=578462 RepID=A0A0L0S720_ALLM3|nr:hypothetical protein AMAG_04942 [Allomyces macrogynus ATCC 38327]|eukprot:KNE58124.1 hypothetical protein AMAG_04942 [Allomyces macrogynus ATCC 38327]
MHAVNDLVADTPDASWSWILHAVMLPALGAVLYVVARLYWAVIRVPPALRHLPRLTAWQAMHALMRSPDLVTAQRKQLAAVAQDARNRGIPLAANSTVPSAWASWLFGQWAMVVANPDDVRAILMRLDAFDKPVFAPLPALFGEQNLVFSPTSEWRHRRKVVNPAFRRGWSTSLFGDLGQQLLVHLDDAAARSTPVPINYWMRRLTLDAIALGAFGQSFHGLTDRNSAVVRDFEAMMENALSPLAALGPSYVQWTPMYAQLRRQVDKFNAFIFDLVDRKKAALKARKAAGLVASEHDMDLLDMMVEAADGDAEYTREDLRSDTIVFFVGGHDTTSNALTAAIYLLARHPAVQDRVRAEVLAALDDVHPTCPVDEFPYLTNDQATRVPFLTAIIKETLRLYPSIPTIAPRITTTTVTMSDGTVLPPGTFVVASTMAIHRSPALWGDDADAFRPERFLDVDSDKMHAGAHGFKWVPFGAGQRVCLGQSFSIMEQRVVLAMLLARYEWTIVGDAEAMKGTPRTTRGGLMQMVGVEAMFKRRE